MGCSFIAGVQHALGSLADNPVVNTVMQFTPLAPVWDAANAVYQASQGNLVGAVASGVGAYGAAGGFTSAGVNTSAFNPLNGISSAYSIPSLSSVTGGEYSPAQLDSVAKAAGYADAAAYQAAGGSLASLQSAAPNVLGGGLNQLTGGASSALSGLTGIGGGGTTAGGGTSGLGLGLQAATNLLGMSQASGAIKNAAQTQADAAAQAGQQQLAIYNQQRADQAPWMAAGAGALGQLSQGTQPGGQFNKPYTLADFQSGPQSGLYTFAEGQAQNAMQNQLRAQGQTGSNVVQGAGQLAGNMANQFYNTGFTQNLQSNQMTANELNSIAGLGQNSTNTVGNQLGSLGTSQSQATLGGANALAQGTLGQAAVQNQGLTSLGNTLAQLLSPTVGA